jgi:D-methionine transport system substrate-binding protein
MKKFAVIVLALVLTLSAVAMAESTTITVGASVTPHAEILEVVKPILKDQGYDLEIVEYMDYILPNTATESGEIDANYFQHELYLTDFNAENDTHLVSVLGVHYEPFGIYAGKSDSIENVADGATIAVPNDGTNEGRALMLLEELGLITLSDEATVTATKLDIVENPHNLDIVEMEAAQLPRVLGEVDYAVINGNYALQGGLNIADALAVENSESEAIKNYYVNVLVVKEGNENNEAIQALVAALQTQEVADFINSTYNGAVVPMFAVEETAAE